MNAEALARYILFGVMVVGCLVLVALGNIVPEWFQVLTAAVGGNTVRLQVTKTTE